MPRAIVSPCPRNRESAIFFGRFDGGTTRRLERPAVPNHTLAMEAERMAENNSTRGKSVRQPDQNLIWGRRP